jgi:hypothetical protein
MSPEGHRGFLVNSESDPERQDFWMFLTNVAGWYAVIAAETQNEHSYFGEPVEADSITRVFTAMTQSGGQFISWMYCADVFRFVVDRFPAHSGGLRKLDYGPVKTELFQYLAEDVLPSS